MIKSNGQVVADYKGPSASSATSQLNRISPFGIYGRGAGFYQWIDDVEIWTDIPGSSTSPSPTPTPTPKPSPTPTPKPSPTPTPTAKPTGTVTASPSTLKVGGSTKVTWSFTNAKSCSGSAFGQTYSSLPTSGSATFSNVKSGTTVKVTCTNSSGSTTKSVVVTVTN